MNPTLASLVANDSRLWTSAGKLPVVRSTADWVRLVVETFGGPVQVAVDNGETLIVSGLCCGVKLRHVFSLVR